MSKNDNFRLHIIEKIVDHTGSDGVDASSLEIPPDQKFGDYAFPCFVLSKKLKKAPQQIAEWLKEKIMPDKTIEKVVVAGPYLNFFVNKTEIAKDVLMEICAKKNNYGDSEFGKEKKVVIEYPAPNTNKPLHLGHMRNIVLGMSMSKILESQGYQVVRVNLNNDRGIHICKSMLAYQKWGDKKTPESENRKSDHFVGDYYVMFSKKVKENPDLDEEAKEMLRKWENDDADTRKLWEKMNRWALEGFNKTYDRIGLAFDKVYYESETFKQGKDIILEGLKNKIFIKRDDGAIIADLSDEGLGEKVLIRPDGTSIYITQDIYLAWLKYKDFKFDKSIYVVATEQQYHFKVLFTILKKIGYFWAAGCYHFSYGMVHLPEGRMKSREGNVVDADDLLDEIEDLADQEIRKRHAELEQEQNEKRKKEIGHGAIRFYLLKTDANKDMTFNPAESVSFEGDTGPYVQYTHARACSILRKAKEKNFDHEGNINFSKLNEPVEIALIQTLGQFPEKVRSACESYRPHIIAQQLIMISRTFNEFYHSCSCLQEDPELAKARLFLVDCTREVIKKGLRLLVIESPEEM